MAAETVPAEGFHAAVRCYETEQAMRRLVEWELAEALCTIDELLECCGRVERGVTFYDRVPERMLDRISWLFNPKYRKWGVQHDREV